MGYRSFPLTCECGCGGEMSELTAQGKPRRFINGHNQRGRTWTEGQRKASRLKTGPQAGSWRGDDVGYIAAHMWLEKHYGHEKTKCDECDGKGVHLEWAYKGLNSHWSRHREDYQVLCKSCHAKRDRARYLTPRQRIIMRALTLGIWDVPSLARYLKLSRKSIRMSLLYLRRRGLAERYLKHWRLTTQGHALLLHAEQGTA